MVGKKLHRSNSSMPSERARISTSPTRTAGPVMAPPSAATPGRGARKTAIACRLPGGELDVPEEGIAGAAHLVLEQAPAVRAVELAELDGGVDESGGIADERIGRLDSPVHAQGVGLVVVAGPAESAAAPRAGETAGALVSHEVEDLGDVVHERGPDRQG